MRNVQKCNEAVDPASRNKTCARCFLTIEMHEDYSYGKVVVVGKYDYVWHLRLSKYAKQTQNYVAAREIIQTIE